MLDIAVMVSIYGLLWVLLPLPQGKGAMLSFALGSFGAFLPHILKPPLGFLLTPPPFSIFAFVVQMVGTACVRQIIVVDVVFSTLSCFETTGLDPGTMSWTSCFLGDGTIGLLHGLALCLHLWNYARSRHVVSELRRDWCSWSNKIRSRRLQNESALKTGTSNYDKLDDSVQCKSLSGTISSHEGLDSMNMSPGSLLDVERMVRRTFGRMVVPFSPLLPLICSLRTDLEMTSIPAEKVVAGLAGKGRRVHIFMPKKTTRRSSPSPVLVVFHGGGWMGGHSLYHPMIGTCYMLALIKKFVVISVDYRRVPEHHLSVVVQDAETAVYWAHRHAHVYGGDANQLFLAGESAGGHLATMVALRLAAKPKTATTPKIHGVVIDYPVTDVGDVGSFDSSKHGQILLNQHGS